MARSQQSGRGASAKGASETAGAQDSDGARFEPAKRRTRVWLVLLAILLPQCALFWPSLLGRRILLPLDVLTTGTNWIPEGQPGHRDVAQDKYLSDTVLLFEINRLFCVDEVRAGRLPLWNPHMYCGAPFLAANHTAVLSPYRLLDYAWRGPEAVAWGQVMKALLAGVGAYLFLRRALQASFLAGLTAAALFPLTGYLILWSGFTLANVATFLPWLLWATDATVRRARSSGVIALAIVTALVIFAGHAANAGHLFIACVIFAAWRAHELYGTATRRAWFALGAVLLGIVLGFALSAPQLLPTLEYMGQSARIAARAAGRIESPPEGWWALLQMLLPYSLGSGERDALLMVEIARPESAAAAYAGLIATLVLAPLALAHREHRRTAICFALLGTFALVPLLDVPLVKEIFRLPPLNVLRNNRFTIVTAFSVVVLAAIGIDALVRGHVKPRRWDWIAIGLCALLAVFGVHRLVFPLVVDHASPEFAWFARYDALGLGVAIAAVVAWFVVRRFGRRAAPILVGTCVIESVILSWGVNVQCERELYYPPLPVLEEIAKRGNGRMLGLECIPPNLAQAAGLDDVRGYDAADPLRMVELLGASANPAVRYDIPYAATMYHVPKVDSGISDLLGLRWIVLSGNDPAANVESFGGHSLFENKSALPRAFVPARVETIADKTQRLDALAAAAFDPRSVAYVEVPVPSTFQSAAQGEARIVESLPTRVTLDLTLHTNALVVIGDAFDPGWNAEVDGRRAEVVVVDHAVRGVFVEAGSKRLVYTYWPKSLTLGLWIAAAAGVFMSAWAVAARRRKNP